MSRFLSDDEVLGLPAPASKKFLSDEDILAGSPDQPELTAGNVARNVAQRGTDLVGNTAEFAGNILSGLEVRAMDALGTEQPLTQGLADLFGNPGIQWGAADQFAAEGREPAFTIGDTAFGFGQMPVRLAGEGLSDVGRLVESTDTGYDPQYTIDRALDDPTLRNIGGAVAEQGPSSLVDMAALFLTPGPYLAGRTQEIAEGRQAADLREGPLPSNMDYAVALPTATIVQAIDRLALGKLLPKGSKAPVTSAGQVPGAVARAAGVEAATEAGQEGIEYVGTAAGTETGLDAREAVRRMIGGAMIGGPVGGLVRGGSGVIELRQAIRQQLANEGVDPDAVSDAELDAAIEQYVNQAEEASQAQALAPENVAPVIDQATGVNTPAPLGAGMPRAEARQARRQVEQELGSLFENETDVLRREDVDVTDEGLQLREGARPAQDPAGRQAQPSTLATYRQAADVLAEAGVEVTPENLDIAVSYLDAGQSPVAAANAFRRAARQGDMREGPTAREQVSDQRRREVAEQAFRLAEARRERADVRRGQLETEIRESQEAEGSLAEQAGIARQVNRAAVPDLDRKLAAQQAQTQRLLQEQAALPAPPRGGPDEGDGGATPPPVTPTGPAPTTPTGGTSPVPAPDQTTAPDAGVDPAQQTEAEAGTLANQLREAETRAAKAEADLAARQQADADRNEAPMTGSNRTADAAAARGQPDSLSQPTAEPTAETRAGDDRRAEPAPVADERRETAGRREGESVSEVLQAYMNGDELTLDQWRLLATHSEVTPLRNKREFTRAWVEHQRRKAADPSYKMPKVVFIDADSLKWYNDNVSHEAGDALLVAVGEELVDAGADAFHVSGDEFLVIVADDASGAQMMDGVQERLAQRRDQFTSKDGQEIEINGYYFTYGVGDNVVAADKKMQATKEAKEKAGERAARGEQPASVRYIGDDAGATNRSGQAGDPAGEPVGGPAEGSGVAPEAGDRTGGAEGSGGADGDESGTVTAEADTDTPKKGPNIQFYSGVPLDAIAAKLKELFGGEAKLWENQLARNSQLMNTIKTAMAGRRPGVNPIAQAIRMYWLDADQRLRSIAERANMPGVKRIADAFFLRAGDAAATGRETFHGRLNKRLNSQIDKVEGIRQAFEDAGLKMDDATMLRVRRMLENPNTPRLGKLGEVVRKMETFFKDELAYQREAGLETGEVKGYLPRVIDKGKISANDATRARFVSAAAKAYKIDNPRMTDAQARELGELRWQREVFGESSGTPGLVLQAGSPGSADFMKGRTLSQKAVEQSGLQDFMVNNPFNLMLGYLQSSAMRAELAKTEIELSDGSTVRIGPNWSNWPQIKQDLVSEGGDAAYEFMPEIEDMVATVSGIKARRHYGRFTRGLSWARTISTLGLLELATLTSLPEPLIGGIRMTKGGSTGGAMMDLANVVKSSARYGGDAARLLLRLPKRERLQATYDLLHSLGEINANNANAMSVDRFAGGEPASLLQSSLLAAYFRGIRLEQFTNYSVAFAAENSMTFMRQLAQDIAAGGKRADNARIHFRDLNIPPAEIDSFAAFVQSLDGGNPTAGELASAGRNGGLYAGAINKFVGESVMRPNAATKPAYAAHPLGASIFQLQSFPFLYTKQVLSRPFRVAQAQAADIGKLEAAYTALPFIVGLTTVVGLQSLLGGMRDEFAELTSGEENPEQSQMFELERALSWAGVFGKVDPILQMISGSRYQKSVFESAAGPTIGRIADGLDTALAAAVNNSPNTTSAERQLWNTSMDLLIEPLLQATASLAPDTGVTGAVMLAARAAGPRALRERGGEALAPREKERLPRYSLAEKLVGADKAPKRDSGRERGRESGRENGRW